jgi:hypothetical protein
MKKQTPLFPDLRWLREPRLIIVACGVMLMVIVTALALVQTPTVAAPPPPLSLPFRLIELPADMAAQTAPPDFVYTPFYTQTFGDNSIYTDTAHWTRTSMPGASTTTWARVLDASAYPSLNLTDTLWAVADPGPGLPTTYTVYAGATYTQNMDAWVILQLPDYQDYARFQAKFDYYLDAGPGATFGWAVSNDGHTFCFHSETGGELQKWQTITFTLPSCSGNLGVPVYLAFFFQSSHTDTPVGLGPFVDNLVISGARWNRSYLPIIGKVFPTFTPTPIASPTPTASPTPPYTLVRSWDFNNPNDMQGWCSTSNSDWSAGIYSSGNAKNAYFLKVKHANWEVMDSPRYTTPDNYRITALFNVLQLRSDLSLYNYAGSYIGLIFGVEGDTFGNDPSLTCQWAQDTGGYYKYIIKIKSNGSGFTERLERFDSGNWVLLGNETDLASASISRSSWNSIVLDRNGSGIVIYINGVMVLYISDGTYKNGRWFGVFTQSFDNIGSEPWEGNWDDVKVYNLTP